MFLVTNSTYPLHKATEIAGRFTRSTPLPSFLKRVNMLTSAGDSGTKVLGIYEVDDDKVADGIKELLKYYTQYFDVEGFKYTVEPMMTVQEALPLIGL